jgi:pimeloyl-ACP methyl ester carboxylesterase
MWGSLTKISVALLATNSPPNYSPASPGQVAGDSRSVYTILREKGPVFTEYNSPTIRFTYVTPPSPSSTQNDLESHSPTGVADWSDHDVMMSDADIMEMTDNGNKDSSSTAQIFSEVAKRHGDDKPIALYLPGLDGYGISAASFQFNDLSKTFELWRMSVLGTDRTSFHDLVQQPVQFIEDIVRNTDRPVYLIGESFGGMLTAAVALQILQRSGREERRNPIEGIVLVNPATSFENSSWDVIAPLLTSLGKFTQQPKPTKLGPFELPSVYSVVGGITLSALIPSQKQRQRILDTFMDIESIRDPSQITNTIKGFLEMFSITSEFLPPDLLEHRIKNWLIVGSSVLVESRLKQLDIPSLIIVGGEDNLLSSKDEAKRLTKLLPQSQELTVREAGHFILDENVNLTEAILYSKIDPLKYVENEKKYDPILDWEMPSTEDINQILSTSVKQLEDNFSPVWVSTNMDGKRSFGIGNVPREGPILFVSNHQLCKLYYISIIFIAIEIYFFHFDLSKVFVEFTPAKCSNSYSCFDSNLIIFILWKWVWIQVCWSENSLKMESPLEDWRTLLFSKEEPYLDPVRNCRRIDNWDEFLVKRHPPMGTTIMFKMFKGSKNLERSW